MRHWRDNPRPGDRYQVPMSTATDWTISRDDIVTVQKADRLGCGCWRLTTRRPGPADGALAGPMELFVDRCQFHADNPGNLGAVPILVERLLTEREAKLAEALGGTP